MLGKYFAPRSLSKAVSTSQSYVPGVQSLSTTSLRPSQVPEYAETGSKQMQNNQKSKNSLNPENKRHTIPPKATTVSQADAELRERLEQISGGGGASGIEYEDGKPNAMKRSVRNNMFRLI